MPLALRGHLCVDRRGLPALSSSIICLCARPASLILASHITLTSAIARTYRPRRPPRTGGSEDGTRDRSTWSGRPRTNPVNERTCTPRALSLARRVVRPSLALLTPCVLLGELGRALERFGQSCEKRAADDGRPSRQCSSDQAEVFDHVGIGQVVVCGDDQPAGDPIKRTERPDVGLSAQAQGAGGEDLALVHIPRI
jgi:hypothetical protein